MLDRRGEDLEANPAVRRPRTRTAANGLADESAFGASVNSGEPLRLRGVRNTARRRILPNQKPARDQLADTIAKFEGGAGAVVASAGHDAGIHFACDPRAAVADRQGPKYGGVAVSLGVELFGGVRAV